MSDSFTILVEELLFKSTLLLEWISFANKAPSPCLELLEDGVLLGQQILDGLNDDGVFSTTGKFYQKHKPESRRIQILKDYLDEVGLCESKLITHETVDPFFFTQWTQYEQTLSGALLVLAHFVHTSEMAYNNKLKTVKKYLAAIFPSMNKHYRVHLSRLIVDGKFFGNISITAIELVPIFLNKSTVVFELRESEERLHAISYYEAKRNLYEE